MPGLRSDTPREDSVPCFQQPENRGPGQLTTCSVTLVKSLSILGFALALQRPGGLGSSRSDFSVRCSDSGTILLRVHEDVLTSFKLRRRKNELWNQRKHFDV